MKTQTLVRLADDFVSLFYPKLCLACGQHLPPGRDIICVSCHYFLPKTQFHQERDNAFTEHFWGRLDIVSGAALYFFTKGSRTQELIHQLKYHQKKEVGTRLGRMYGEQLKSTPWFQTIDAIVPVPLHPRKERLRGYNQSALFAEGLSETLGVPAYPYALERKEFTETQTRKSRLARVENVSDVFVARSPDLLKDRYVLLVDDVMTTGATLEACGQTILDLPGTRLSLATIAIAKR